MRIDVLLGEAPVAPSDVADRMVVVIDVLRAATTSAVALMNGATSVIPFETVHDATAHARALDPETVRLGGERHMRRLPGFDFGNSPLEYSATQVAGRHVVLTTTNGTLALASTAGASLCLFAGMVNAQATIDALCAESNGDADVTIVCAGAERQVSLEDAVCAGRIVRHVRSTFAHVERGDGARLTEILEHAYQTDVQALANDATHARSLIASGFAGDVALCLNVDSVPLAVRYRNGQLRRYDAAAA